MTHRFPAVVLLAALLCMAAEVVRGQGPNSGMAMAAAVPLMTVKDIRAKNKANVPVMVRGVVTAMDVVRIYLQDETGAIGIIRAAVFQPVAPGDLVEVKGTTTGQGAGLGLNGLSLVKTAIAAQPVAKAFSAEQLDASESQHQRVRVSGTVHEVGVSSGMLVLQVQSGDTSFMAMWQGYLPNSETRVLAPRMDLMDADVELVGVAVPQFSQAGYRNGFRLVMASDDPDHLKVLKKGSSDVFSRPLRTLESFQGMKSHENQRYVIKGVVTYWSDAGWFHVQDETSTVRVNNADLMPQQIGWLYRSDRSEPVLVPGDNVEVVGMPEVKPTGSVSFTRCEWRVTSHTAPPPFLPTSAAAILKGGYDGRSVSVTGRVIDVEVSMDYQGFAVHTLWMESEDVDFSAMVQKRRRGKVSVKAGDYVRVTGVATTAPNVVGRSPFRINLNDFTNIHVVPPPPAWRSANVIRWVLVGAAVLGFGLMWIFILRRQVAWQTAQLRRNALQLQEQLDQEKELSEMKSRFVFTVSHEFRNPLAIIMSCSDVLQRAKGKLTPEEHERQISGIQLNVRRMADMMEEVLLLGRAEAGRLPCNPEPVNLQSFCQRLVDQIRSVSDARCPIELSVEKTMPNLMLDTSMLHHILGNLVSNAVKFSPPGLCVDVKVLLDDIGVCFTIHDQGMGVPTMDRPRIFEPFHRGSNVGETAGTGLGLAIAERCARAHGGSITCESDPGDGTTFCVHLPATIATTKPSLASI
ncbi:MAG: HAMP domain-containing sensor histidine kinase [Verrucomicrobiota bacterium]